MHHTRIPAYAFSDFLHRATLILVKDDFLDMLLRDDPETAQEASLVTQKFLSAIFAALHTTSNVCPNVSDVFIVFLKFSS